MLRRISTSPSTPTVFSLLSSHLFLVLPRRFVHESLPEPHKPVLADESIETAKSALLQLNVMVSQGIEPDAEMYTSLIATMGRAKLEFQAFKLFSRMLEQGVKPLPETYLALKRATNPVRRKVVEQIEAKLVSSVQLLPQQLATAVAEQKEQSRRAADKNMRQMLNPKSFSSSSTAMPQVGDPSYFSSKMKKGDNTTTTTLASDDGGGDIPTMHIDSVESVMATIQALDERHRHSESVAKGEQRQSLLKKLEKLHEEELRVLLAVHRQSRVGTRVQLLRRVVTQVPAAYLEQMLDRRSHYFDSVKQVLELQISELKEQKQQQQQQQQENEEKSASEADELQGKKDDEALTGLQHQKQSVDALSALSSLDNTDRGAHLMEVASSQQQQQQQQEKVVPSDASAMTEHEKFALSPPHLEAPWGLLRRPPRGPANAAPQRNKERDKEALLSTEELSQLENSLAGSTGLDGIPTQTLRRYCRHFHLKWRRKRGRAELQDLVEWHLRNFKPNRGSPADTTTTTTTAAAAASLGGVGEIERADAEEQERRAQQQTIEQYNSLLAVAKMTENMTMVDDAAVSRAVIQQRSHERYMKKMAARDKERELVEQRKRNLDKASQMIPNPESSDINNDVDQHRQSEESSSLLSSTAAAASAMPKSSVLLGLESTDHSSPRPPPPAPSSSSSSSSTQELPPWEAMSTSTPLNLRTGKFDVGVPHAEFFEDATGKLRVRQPMALRGKYSVDVDLLPGTKQAALREQRLEQQETEDRERAFEERKQSFRVKSGRAKRFDKWLDRVKTKEREKEAAAEDHASGGDADADAFSAQRQRFPRRMSSKLRVGEVPFRK